MKRPYFAPVPGYASLMSGCTHIPNTPKDRAKAASRMTRLISVHLNKGPCSAILTSYAICCRAYLRRKD
jgi:hypothetical protein